jgi:FkbM family methyltransferase
MRAAAVSKITRLYPFRSGCGSLANHRFLDALAGSPKHEAWADVEGGKLLVSLDDYVGRAAYYVGDLDRKISALIDRYVKPGDTVLDIGANIGLLSLRMAKRVGPSGTVHAFEPNPAVAGRLEATLASNRISNVRVHKLALGAESSILRLEVPADNAGAASLKRTKANLFHAYDVNVVPLDDLSLSNVSFVKIDVEGFEEEVLKGFSRTLKKSPPKTIVFEQTEPSGCFRLLRNAGYSLRGIAKTLHRLKLDPVSDWSPAYHDYVAIAH